MPPHRLAGVEAPASAYIHIPFCHRVCPYCDFAVVAGRTGEAERYVAALVQEIQRSEPWQTLGSVFVGGGTPSAIDPNLISQILDALDVKHGLKTGAEVTMEVNPEDWLTAKATRMKAAGINRVSLGAQSFDPLVLASLGRVHSPVDVHKAFEVTRSLGFASVSLDLIFGDPIETPSSWADTLGQALALAPDHVSTYALTVEKGTQLSREVSLGAQAPDDDIQADRYLVAEKAMESTSLERYEVSNYAEPGFECRYNRRVWAHGTYEAYGLGAHGFRDGTRFRNVRSLDAYLSRVEAGESPRQGQDPIGGWPGELERLMVGLRRVEGAKTGDGGRAFLASEEGQRYVDANVVTDNDGWLVVNQPLLTDGVIRAVLALEPRPN